LKRKRWN